VIESGHELIWRQTRAAKLLSRDEARRIAYEIGGSFD
jgi:hypothetical protein